MDFAFDELFDPQRKRPEGHGPVLSQTGQACRKISSHSPPTRFSAKHRGQHYLAQHALTNGHARGYVDANNKRWLSRLHRQTRTLSFAVFVTPRNRWRTL